MRMHLAILRGAALLVPFQQRAEWLSEWRSELWYVRQSRGTRGVTAFCLGAFKDALWLRRNAPRPEARKLFRLDSPVKCVLFLALLAAVSLFLAIRVPYTRVRASCRSENYSSSSTCTPFSSLSWFYRRSHP
jgi:hypothetical protein